MKKILTIGISAFVLAFVGVSSVSADVGYGGGGGSISGTSRRVVDVPVVTPASSPVVSPVAPQGKVLGATSFNFTSTLKRGLTSDSVKQLQDRLRTEGFFKHTSTGYFGPLTFTAVKAYQKAHNLPSTGLVGSLTIAELNK